jgi:hypothetical protein
MECNSVKDPNIISTTLLVKTKEGLTDVWKEGKCLGKGLSDEEINNLYLK